MDKPTILITNDDSIYASGISHLIRIAKDFGKVVVVAPDSPRSGAAHSITTQHPLRLQQRKIEENYTEYSVNGTPVDCVKLAIKKVLMDEKPDLLISGINHGSNATVNLLYSGTMAAAIEGCMSGIPSIGFSFNSFAENADFSSISPYVQQIISHVLNKGLAPHTCLNVNLPAVPKEQIKGIKVCRQGLGYWNEDFQKRVDPHGKPYYWMMGEYISTDNDPETDEIALQNDYVTVVPISYDMTNYDALHSLKNSLTPDA